MTAMIALALTPAACVVAAMVLAMKGESYGGFLLVAVICAFFIAGVVSEISK